MSQQSALQTSDVARSLRHSTGRSRHSWYRGLSQGKVAASADEFAHAAMVPSVSRNAFVAPSAPTLRRGYALPGAEDLAPILVKAREGKPKPPGPQMADFGHATDHLEAQLLQYRAMSPQERADWVYGKTVAEYVPPMVKPEPRWYRQLRPGTDYRQSNMAPVY